MYSAYGLESKGIYFELTGDYPEAFSWFAKIEDRYDESEEMIAFCYRYKKNVGDTRFDGEFNKRIARLFPKGLENAGLNDFTTRPADGVRINRANNNVIEAGMNEGDVIVAVNGIRVHNLKQYYCARWLSMDPELSLIVWRRKYSEIKANVPNHSFGYGADFADYGSRY